MKGIAEISLFSGAIYFAPFLFLSLYRVFKKLGEKVNGYYATKNWILEAIYGFIFTTCIGHLIIYIWFYIFLH